MSPFRLRAHHLIDILVVAALATVALLAATHSAFAQATRLRFSGYEWEVRSAGLGGPGPNQWDSTNVTVDRKGRLHLKISHVGDAWRCAELHTIDRFGFGRYQFQVSGPIDKLDRNAVLGLFKYPTADVGKDGTNEIDIEIARWGDPKTDNGSFSVYPITAERVGEGAHKTFAFTLKGENTTHRFDWESGRIRFASLSGYRDNNSNEIAHWDFTPEASGLIPQLPTPVFINLWLFRGRAPADGQEIELVITRFTFKPFGRTK